MLHSFDLIGRVKNAPGTGRGVSGNPLSDLELPSEQWVSGSVSNSGERSFTMSRVLICKVLTGKVFI